MVTLVLKDMSGILAKHLRVGALECEAASVLLEDKENCLTFLKYYALGDAARLNPSQWSRLADLKESLEKFSGQLSLGQFDIQDGFYLQDLKKPVQVDLPQQFKEISVDDLGLDHIDEVNLLNFKVTNELLKQADVLHLMRMKLFSEGVLNIKEKVGGSEYLQSVLAEFSAEKNQSLKKINPFLYLRLWQLHKNGQISLQIQGLDTFDWLGEKPVSKNPNIQESINFSLRTYIFPKLLREVLALAYDKAVDAMMPVLDVQFRHAFRQAPLPTKTMLMIYPHGKSGVMLVCVNETGELLDESMLYPFAPDYNQEDGLVHLSKLLTKHPIEDIAWLVQPETKRLIQKLLAKIKERYAFLNWRLHPISNRYQHWFVPKGQKHPTLENVLRACHFVQNPWLFWAAISPDAILNPLFAHLPKHKVKKLWLEILQEFLLLNGLDLLNADKALLSLVDGLPVEELLKAREEHAIKSKGDLKQVLGLNDKVYERINLFFRMSADEPKNAPLFLDEENQTDISTNKLKVIQKAMEQEPVFYEESRRTVLKPGQKFYGLVTRIMSYGVFVDLGDKMEGLLHVSAVGDCFINDLNLMFQPGDLVVVECVSFDEQKKRLSLKLCSSWELPNLTLKSQPVKKDIVKKTQQKAQKPKREDLSMSAKSSKIPQAPTAMELAFAKLKQQS